MSCVSSDATERFKSALAEETGRIQVMIQTKLESYDGFALQETKETDYDTAMGYNPRSIRYRKARMVHEDYKEFLGNGENELRDFEVAGCSAGDSEVVSALADKQTGPSDTRGTTVYLGYDEFGRTAKRTAIESEIIDLLSIMERKNPGMYISMLREALVESALERYERAVLKDILHFAYHKTSVNPTFRATQGGTFFDAVPSGVLSIGTLDRLADRLHAWKYSEGANTPLVNGQRQIRVYAGRTQVEQAVENRKKAKGMIHMSELYSNDPSFGETLIFQGYQFIINKLPPRGYLRQVSAGGVPMYEFVEVYPTINQVATGEGVVEVPNDDYYNCTTTCNGVCEKLYEMVFITHPDGLERQRFQVPRLHEMFSQMHATYASFDVEFINDRLLFGTIGADGCSRNHIYNEDLMKAKMKIRHAYAPFTMHPEKMAAVLVCASPDCIEIFAPNCPDCPEEPVVAIGTTSAPGVASTDGCEVDTLEAVQRDYAEGQVGPGLIRMESCTVNVCKIDGVWAQTLKLCVTRVGGADGVLAADIATADGTAVDGTNYTAVSTSVSFDDKCGGSQCIEIPILEDVSNVNGLNFTATLSNATLDAVAFADGIPASNGDDGCVTATVNFSDPDPSDDPACGSC